RATDLIVLVLEVGFDRPPRSAVFHEVVVERPLLMGEENLPVAEERDIDAQSLVPGELGEELMPLIGFPYRRCPKAGQSREMFAVGGTGQEALTGGTLVHQGGLSALQVDVVDRALVVQPEVSHGERGAVRGEEGVRDLPTIGVRGALT